MSKNIVMFLALTIMCLPGSAQTPNEAAKPGQKTAAVPRYVNPASGLKMYVAYCASCHGSDGKGYGPVAADLKVAPTDLTQLSANNKGSYPRDHVVALIQGRAVSRAHGKAEMPVWGPFFLTLDNQSEAVVQQRASNLAKYIESLQAK